jgi:uncharacterized protein DUF3224
MTIHGTGTFEIKSWDENTWDGKPHKDVKGAKQTYAVVKQLFHGVIEGESDSHSVMTYRDDESANYVGLQTVVGKIGDRSGSFVMQSVGAYDPKTGIAETTLTIIPGSASGGLKGLKGKGTYSASHGDQQPYTLDYDFE